MAPNQKQALAAEKRKSKKLQQDAAAAEEEKAKAMAENARLKEQLRQQLAKQQQKSGRSSHKSVAIAPSKKRKEAPSDGAVAHKSRKEAPSDGAVAHKSRRSGSKQGLSDESMPTLTPNETKMKAMLGAKRQFGGRGKNTEDGVPDEMLTRIHTAIKNGVFDDHKYVLGPKGKKKLVKAVLDHLKMEGYTGDSPRAIRNKEWFSELYADHVVASLNQVRSTCSTECKKAAKAFFDLNDGQLPSDDDLERLISRQLDLKNARDYKLFEWYQMTLMPRACGAAANWNKSKREYLTLSRGAPQNTNKPYITTKTEAYAVWLMKGNAIRWKRQFEIGEMDKYKGRIQRLLGPAKPKKKKVELVEMKDPEGDNVVADGENEEDGKGNADEDEAGEEDDKAQADEQDKVSESFFMFIWHCFIAQLPLF